MAASAAEAAISAIAPTSASQKTAQFLRNFKKAAKGGTLKVQKPSLLHHRGDLSQPKTNGDSTRLAALCSDASALPSEELGVGELATAFAVLEVGRACALPGLRGNSHWEVLSSRLASAEGNCVVAAARAFAAARVRDEQAIGAIANRGAELARSSRGMSASACSSLIDSLGKLASKGDGYHTPNAMSSGSRARTRPSSVPSWAGQAAKLEQLLIQNSSELRVIDMAMALSGLARLRATGTDLSRAIQPRLRGLTDAAQDGTTIEPRHGAMLVSAISSHARLGIRHDEVLQEIGNCLAAASRLDNHIPPEFVVPFVRALATNLKPAPTSLALVIKCSVPPAVPELNRDNFVLLLRALAFVPGLATQNYALRKAVFSACLEAPLEDLHPDGLVAAIRSAWALGHEDISFWAPALKATGTSISRISGSSVRDWRLDGLSAVALVLSRILERAATIAPAGLNPVDAPVSAAAAAAAGDAPALLTVAPAASSLLLTVCGSVAGRVQEMGPHEVAVLATAIARVGQDQRMLFSLLAHQALHLLSQRPATFNSQDIAQLLCAQARFQYHDEVLLSALATRAESGFEHFDEKAKDIIIWSLLELGFETSAPGVLADAMLEYELKTGRINDKTSSHFQAIEVIPFDEDDIDQPAVSAPREANIPRQSDSKDESSHSTKPYGRRGGERARRPSASNV